MPLLSLPDLELHYEVHGQGDPLLLIHGLGSSCRDWEPQIGDFQKHFQVITMDLRGHGNSGKPKGPYSMQLFARDTAFLLEELNAYPVNVLGMSLGGMVAFQLALDFPGLVRKLVIVNSVAELVPQNLRDVLGYWQRLVIIRFFGMEKMGRVLAERFFTEPEQEALRDVFVDRWSENHKPSYRAALKAAYGWSVLERLGEIQVPTLVVGADGDYFPTEDKEAYTALISGAKLVVFENTKHALPAEKPEEFNQVVERFLLS